ncbi:MAG: hypothetical protein QOD32_6 [Pyrinomonadaceae bacterium]|jgi:hypothetical protein|nr:hypothetical protein [Pyrinomonadaceae bacterium]
MKRKFFAISLTLLLAGVLFAQEQAQPMVKLTGYLIDNACAGAADADKDFEDEAKGHSVRCAMMPACVRSGYALAVGKKLYKLDEAGNKSALQALKATKTAEGLKVEVEGTVEGHTLRVTKLTEVATK